MHNVLLKEEACMKIVLLESLGISQEILSGFAQQLEKQGHQFVSYEKNADEQVQIERAQVHRHFSHS